MHRVIELNENWLFHRGDISTPMPKDKGSVYTQSKTERKLTGPASYKYFDSPDPFYPSCELKSDGWSRVSIPHDYIIDGQPCKNENNALGYLHYDNAWYRKHFDMPAGCEGKRVILRFDGIAGRSTVYLNGCEMHHNFSSYNTFEVDISNYVYYDKENIIAVYVNTREFEGWWYQGGGIYRDVWLDITETVAIEYCGVFAPSKRIDDQNWEIDYETTVVNTGYDIKNITVKSFVCDAEGTCVSTAECTGTIALRDKNTLKYTAVVSNPALWDCDNPNLYTVKTLLFSGDEEIDESITRIGFRTVEFSAEKGFLLNGKKTFINGVCAHQDFGLTGLAVPDNIAKYKMKLIKEMGANGYRTSHYQQTAAYLDACDEMGLLVMDEARWFESTEESFKQLESLIKRDRNRPSVIMWSTSNEEPFHVIDIGKRLHKAIAAHIRKFDNTRCITLAEDKSPEKSTVYDECSVIGINYNLQIYDTINKMYPDKLLFASECCATGTTRDWNYPSDQNGRIQDKDADTNEWFLGREKTYKFLKSRDYIFGCYQWAAVEHRGEAVWPAICSKSGALDLFLQKKGAFYQNKSHWTAEPMAHIVPHWNFEGLEGEKIPVTVYTNCDELEIFLNGKSFGKKQIEKYGHGEWSIPYETGTLIVSGYRDGKKVCEDKRITTGKAFKLKLTSDNEFKANGRDIALFTCECVDEKGNTVPDASPFVAFTVNSPARIIGTGSDNCDHNNVTSAERKMYMGKIRIAVKPGKGQKQLRLIALSDQCSNAAIQLDID